MLNQPHLVKDLIHFVEKEHHVLEEESLFPLVKDQSFLCKGGPRCSYFMGLRLDYNIEDEYRSLLKKFFTKTSFRPRAYPVPSWMTKQSPLSIPFEEHVLGAEIAESLLYLTEQPTSDLYTEFYESFYESYCRLLRLHIDKEDHCLFIMCEQNMN
ncbi:MAG: hypothetical protein ACXVCY_03295 [Pseudobdellovibrionaceae bacterium]